MFRRRYQHNDEAHSKKSYIKERKEIEIAYYFLISEETMNASTIKKDVDRAREVIHCSVVNDFVEDDYNE